MNKTDWVSEEEVQRIILLMAARDEGATDFEMDECVKWVRKVRVASVFLELFLDGKIEFRLNKDRIPVFRAREPRLSTEPEHGTKEECDPGIVN